MLSPFLHNPLLGLLGFVLLIFELWMIYEAIINKHLSNTARFFWILGMLLIYPFIGIIYYFIEYGKKK